ncbi:hypothetical protein [Catenulispora pinisilvae]|uniref:hypothetical protein n=1 Tax=Catenulispora pinisilvae TaxID=2705253 RepID=UPI0018918720|nr:hypothetical protein [Catenulispora pinisilvae]
MLTISRRFNGPPHSGNGGYVSGMLAQLVLAEFGDTPGAKVEVTLRKPPPLEKPLTVRQPEESESLRLLDGSTVIAEAELVEAAGELIEPVSYDEAVTAAKGYAGLSGHPFLTCFVCGPDHPSGLHVYPGPVPGRKGVVAAPWTPTEDTVGPEFVWGALDCPGGWSAGDLADRPMVLGRMSVEMLSDQPVLAGERYVVLGRHLRTEGRKTFTVSALYGPSGEPMASAEAVWIAVDPATVRPVVTD